jgi:nicotinamidase-related amidase
VRQEFALDLSDAFLEMRKRGIRSSIAGTEGARLDPRLDVGEGDPVIVKKRYSAFHGTNLDDLLAARGIGEIVLAGVNTHACIRMAAIDAYQRDLKVTVSPATNTPASRSATWTARSPAQCAMPRSRTGWADRSQPLRRPASTGDGKPKLRKR